MSVVFEIKRGDLEPRLRVTLYNKELDGTKNPINLTVATGITFVFKLADGSLVFDRTATFIDRANGVVEYSWQVGDTDVIGIYNCEFHIDWNGRTQTVPNKNFFQIAIRDGLQ